MVDCFNEIAADPLCRVVVVSGAGKIFSAGVFPAARHVLSKASVLESGVSVQAST